MATTSNDNNPKGTRWFQKGIYGKETTLYPEEDYQIDALPKTILYSELGRRLNVIDPKNPILYSGTVFDFSAVSDKQLMHHIALKIEEYSLNAQI